MNAAQDLLIEKVLARCGAKAVVTDAAGVRWVWEYGATAPADEIAKWLSAHDLRGYG